MAVRCSQEQYVWMMEVDLPVPGATRMIQRNKEMMSNARAVETWLVATFGNDGWSPEFGMNLYDDFLDIKRNCVIFRVKTIEQVALVRMKF